MVGGIKDDGVIRQTELFEQIHDLARGDIELFDDVTVEPRGAAAEAVARVQNDVRHGMRDVKNERSVLAARISRSRAGEADDRKKVFSHGQAYALHKGWGRGRVPVLDGVGRF